MSDASNREEPRADPGERGTEDARSESAPRRVGEVRQEREAERETEQRRRENELGTSWTSVIFGLLAALGASLILSGIVGGVRRRRDPRPGRGRRRDRGPHRAPRDAVRGLSDRRIRRGED